MDWAFEMPQKTKYMSEQDKSSIIRTLFENQQSDQISITATTKPILVIFPGIGSNETEIYIQNAVRQAYDRGYQPVVIQYRGASGMQLTSPMTYGCGQHTDVNESIEYIYQEYCSEIDRKIFALGFSLGGNWLGMGLAKHK